MQMPVRVGDRFGTTLPRADAVGLGAHHGPVGDVEVSQRFRRRIVGGASVVLEELRAEVAAPQEFQIHRQERGIVDAVDVAQSGVELQAVQQHRPVGLPEDVVGQQIGVAVDDAALGDPLGEQRLTPREEFADQPLDLIDDVAGQQGWSVTVQFGQVVAPPLLDRRAAAVGVDLG